MKRRSDTWSCVVAICCALSLIAVQGTTSAQDEVQASAKDVSETAGLLSPDQLDSLVAPIALYPDNLLAQVLVASTYPLEIMQLQQWMEKNPDLEGDALADAVATQPWDPSIQSMAVVPEAVDRLANDIQWTTELGNAFLAQQSDVMDAVQRMRKGAQDKGALESNEQQVVETKVVEQKTVIVVQPADPEVIYVPSYNPTYVYPPPVYPYPPVYYPPYYAGGAFVSFSVGFFWGAAVGGACCGCGWGNNDVNIDIDNNFNRNIDRGDRSVDRGDRNVDRGDRGGGTWQHDPKHRGGTPYSDRATADKFGGTARGDSLSSRQASARQQQAGRQGGARGSSPSAGSMNRSAGGAGSLSGSLSGGSLDRSGAGSGSRSGSPSAGADRIGSRSLPSSGSSRSSSAFSGGSPRYSGSSARSFSSRGASSMGSRGGGSRGGGGRRR